MIGKATGRTSHMEISTGENSTEIPGKTLIGKNGQITGINSIGAKSKMKTVGEKITGTGKASTGINGITGMVKVTTKTAMVTNSDGSITEK